MTHPHNPKSKTQDHPSQDQPALVGPLNLFPIGLGCTGMTPHSYSDSPRRQEMIQVLRTAAELGVEFFDTSEILVV